MNNASDAKATEKTYRLFDGADAVGDMTAEEFFAANEDMREEYQGTLNRLDIGDFRHFGGGASGEFSITRIK